MTYRFSLEPYKGRNTRYTCPACNHRHVFTRYTDNTTGQHLAEHVGRCSREVNCGYHYGPRQYFNDTGLPPVNTNSYTPQPRRQPSFIDHQTTLQSFAGYDRNNFVQFLISKFGRDIAADVVQRYHVGTSKHWHGATVFWQVDRDQYVRTGKIMLYDSHTGKRVKHPYNHITWVHTALRLTNFELRQCLFGEHLLHNEPHRPIAIVESEKTAIIASIYLPQYTWLACGSLSGLTPDKCSALRGHNVTLFPDLGCYQQWKEKARALSHIITCNVSQLLEHKASRQEKVSGLDLGDYLLRFEVREVRDGRI